MIRRCISILALAAMLGCADRSRPPLEVSDVELFAALPGASASVGYLTLQNNTKESVRITEFRSSAFGTVELHETTLEDGVARMRKIAELTLPARESRSLTPGALHLMLMDPGPDAVVGRSVTLTVHYGSGGEVRIEAPLQARRTGEHH